MCNMLTCVQILFQTPVPCVLHVDCVNGGTFPVADGRIYPCVPGTLVHFEPLPDDCLRVSIDRVYEKCGEMLAPCPLIDEDRLGNLTGTVLQWPARLVRTQVLFRSN